MKGKICKINTCEKIVTRERSAVCSHHRYIMERYKSFEKPKLPEGIIKICKKHGNLIKEQTYTYSNNKTICCILCRREQILSYQRRNPAQRMFYSNDNARKLKKHFQMTKEQYEEMFNNQKGLCAICKRPESKIEKNSLTKKPNRLSVDHCHRKESNGIIKIRGLLCFKCNMGIAHLEENIDFLLSAIEYLKAHQD